ncbi:T9SS type A sorting domain-containing protein [bacterium]|nr:T9SS type A sorting domain-containing protein [bacterium]
MRRHLLSSLLAWSLCGVALPAAAAVEFSWSTPTLVRTGGEFAYLEFYGLLSNTGTERDTYALHKEDLLPNDFVWSTSICVGGFCYAPFVTDITTPPVDPGSSLDIRLDFTIGMAVGTGYGRLRVSSVTDPQQMEERGFVAIHNAADLLVIDDCDDPFLAFGHFNAIAPQLAGETLGHWPRALQLPTLAELQTFPIVFWLTGESQSTLDASDRALLGSYLTGAGALLVSGDEIAWDLCDPASPHYSAANVQWVSSFFDITYELDMGGTSVVGAPGSDVGAGLAFALADPAANPDVISLSRAGALQFSYGGGGGAGSLSTGGKRILYLGFDLADVPAGPQAALLDNALIALAAPSASDTPALPARLTLLPNQPNPFNPKTTLRFQAPAAGLALVEVLDLRGRVLTSFTAELRAGENALPFTAVDAAGRPLASGTYFYRVQLNGESVSGKMTLLK